MKTRTRLLEAAERVFVKQGFHGTSVEDVAEEAGYSKGAVYSNFESKDELFLAVLERRVDTRLQGLEGQIAPDAPITVQAVEAGNVWLDVFRDSQWSLLLMEFATYAARRPDLRERFAARNRHLRSAIPGVIEERLDALGLESPVSIDKLAMIFFALGSGFNYEKLLDPEAVPDQLFGDALALMLSGLKTSEATDPREPQRRVSAG